MSEFEPQDPLEDETAPAPAVPAAQSDPASQVYWDWIDVCLFIGLAAPAVFLASLLSRGVMGFFPHGGLADVIRLAVLQILWYGLLFGGLFVILQTRYGYPFFPSLGWRPLRPETVGLFLVLGPPLAIGIGLLGLLLRAPQMHGPLEKLLSDRMAAVVVSLLAVSVGPIAEELAFRGLILPLLLKTFPPVIAVLIDSMAFGLIHAPEYGWSWQHVVLLTVASSAFCAARIRTNSTVAPTLMHATYNLMFSVGLFMRKDQLF